MVLFVVLSLTVIYVISPHRAPLSFRLFFCIQNTRAGPCFFAGETCHSFPLQVKGLKKGLSLCRLCPKKQTLREKKVGLPLRFVLISHTSHFISS